MSAKAAWVRAAPFSSVVHYDELTITKPVIAHTTTVSQNVAVEETRA